MPDIWTIKGEAGKSIDATERTLPELRMEGLEINTASLADDEATWTVWLKTLAEISTHVPDWGQKITVYLNGARYFTGHVTGREPSFSAGRWGYAITVSGPWYFLREISIETEVADQTGEDAPRAMFLFPTGSPRDHLISLITVAIAAGVPVSMGSMATCFDVPRLSLREMSFAEAISELMRWLADGLIYIDYSGSDATPPAICMQRRAAATTIEIEPAQLAVPELRIRPRIDLQVTRVSLKTARRATDGNQRKTLWQNYETAPVAATPLPSRQIITTTGPELDTWLPADFTDSVVVQSAAISGHVGEALSLWHDLLKAGGVADIDVYQTALSDTAAGITTNWPSDPMLVVTDSEGNALDLEDWPYYLTKGEIRDWFEKDGIESVRARVTATVAQSVTAEITDDAPAMPQWARIVGARASSHFLLIAGILHVRYVWQATVSTVVPLVKNHWPEDTTLIRQEDWGWVNPPADLADNLLATQNWLPYEGPVPIAVDEIPAGNPVGSVLNIAGWVPETAAMRALISGCSVRPATGQITYLLGPPARHSYRDLVNRFRQSGADNIYWLGTLGDASPGGGDPGSGPPAGSILHEDGTTYEMNEDATTYPTTEDT
jgi:hypothetical protein